MAPFALHMMTRAERRAARGWLGAGMAIGLVCGGLMMASLVLWIEHLLGGIIHGADLAMWLLAAATLTALFLLVFLALIPHFARVTEQRARRMVRPPGTAAAGVAAGVAEAAETATERGVAAGRN